MSDPIPEFEMPRFVAIAALIVIIYLISVYAFQMQSEQAIRDRTAHYHSALQMTGEAFD